MESCPTQAALPLVGLAAEKIIRDRYKRRSRDACRPPGRIAAFLVRCKRAGSWSPSRRNGE
ncbi:MAG: hypothetical protein ACQESR_19390 [Planctomycetota bacterium]